MSDTEEKNDNVSINGEEKEPLTLEEKLKKIRAQIKQKNNKKKIDTAKEISREYKEKTNEIKEKINKKISKQIEKETEPEITFEAQNTPKLTHKKKPKAPIHDNESDEEDEEPEVIKPKKKKQNVNKLSKKVSIKYYHEPSQEEMDFDTKMLESFNNNNKPKKENKIPELTSEDIEKANNEAYLQALRKKYLSP